MIWVRRKTHSHNLANHDPHGLGWYSETHLRCFFMRHSSTSTILYLHEKTKSPANSLMLFAFICNSLSYNGYSNGHPLFLEDVHPAGFHRRPATGCRRSALSWRGNQPSVPWGSGKFPRPAKHSGGCLVVSYFGPLQVIKNNVYRIYIYISCASIKM